MIHFDLTDLRLFLAIAEANSLTKGAEATFISASAASIRIKNLEESVGTKLLFRSSHGVTLSPPGQALAHHARLVVGQLEHLRNDLQEYSSGIKGHLRVFASTTAITDFLPAVLSRYLTTHPDVNVDLRERGSGDIVRAVSDGHTDIGIVSGRVRTEGLESMPYREDRLVLVVPANHPLTQQPTVAFADTLQYEHVVLHEGTAIHSFLNQIARSLNQTLKQRIQVGNFEACCRMTEAGVGVSIMPSISAERYHKHMAVEVLQLQDDWARRNLQVCFRSLDSLPGFARDLVTLLKLDSDADLKVLAEDQP